MSEGSEARGGSEGGEGVTGKNFCRSVTSENEVCISDSFLSGHVPSVEGIDQADQQETENDDKRVFSKVFCN